MSAPTKQTAARRPATQKANSRVTQYVDQQLERTRRQVKSTDLIASLLLLVVMVVGFLLLAAIVDAWVFTLTPLMRWSALLLLVAGCIGMMAFSIWPLLTKKINPDYAAKMLEDSKPGFRNSVLNYVWFRKKPDGIRSAVFDAVARQAAVDLNSVPADSSVDRSKVIRLGFWLVGVTAAFIVYFMLSPKNPFQTLNRVMFPSADLAKPAVVTISDVTPGNDSVFFGDQVEITAKVYGPHSPDEVQLVYSTNDSRQLGQVMLMQPDPTTPRQYKVDLTKNTGGLRESLEYEIVARDGQSGKFEIKVAPRPSIAIESIYIESPKYTKLKPQTTLQGAIDGVEGATVTLSATANLEIDNATIEFLKKQPTAPNEDQKFKLVRAPMKMNVDSKNARIIFQLTLDTNREKPFATHYRLNFTSTGGKSPEAPNVYPIRIIPDLAPELEVRNPTEPESKVAANGRLAVVAMANDLDYEISVVKININRRGNEIASKVLPLKIQADSGRKAQARYLIKPKELGLKPGDQGVFYLTAADNRTTYFSDTDPAPNVTRSKNYSFTVTEPNKGADSQSNKNEAADPPPSDGDPDEKNQDSESSEENSKGEEGTGASDKGDSDDSGEPNDNSDSGDDESAKPDGSESSEDAGASDSKQENQPSENSQDDNSEAGTEGSNDPQPSEENPSESPSDDNSEGGEPESDSAPEDGGSGASDQNPQDPADGGGGSEAEDPGGEPENKTDGGGGDQRPSDDPDADASNARSGNDPTGGDASDTAPENKDEGLTEGDEQLSSDASEAEQVRRLEELLSENPELREKSADQEQANADQNPEGENNPEGGRPSQTENPEIPQDNDGSDDRNSEPEDPSEAGNQADPQQKQQTPRAEDNPGSPGSDSESPNSQDPQDSTNDDPSGNDSSSDTGESDSQKASDGDPASDSKSDQPKNQQDPEGAPKKPSGEAKAGEPESGQPESGDPNAGQPGDQPESQDPTDSKSSDAQGGDEPKSEGPADSNQESKPSKQESPSKPGQPPSGQSPESAPPGGESDGPAGEESGESDGPPQQTKPKGDGGNLAGSGDQGQQALMREKENLEYSQKKIDLLLDDLRSQRQNPNEELLKKMNWSAQDLNDFIDSHDEMRAAAEQGEVQAKRNYERRLKSYGLRPAANSRAVAGNKEKAGEVNQDGAVNEVPPEQKFEFNSFLQDLQRAQQ